MTPRFGNRICIEISTPPSNMYGTRKKRNLTHISKTWTFSVLLLTALDIGEFMGVQPFFNVLGSASLHFHALSETLRVISPKKCQNPLLAFSEQTFSSGRQMISDFGFFFYSERLLFAGLYVLPPTFWLYCCTIPPAETPAHCWAPHLSLSLSPGGSAKVVIHFCIRNHRKRNSARHGHICSLLKNTFKVMML